MPVTYDASFKVAVVALARIEGAFTAARMARVSVNTVKAWMAADEGVDHDEAEWAAAQKLAQSRHLQALISGKATGAGQWAMSAGISQRNKRMVAVQKRWDARKTAEQEAEKPEEKEQWQVELHALDDAHGRLLYWEQLDRPDPVPTADLDKLPDATPDEVNAKLLELVRYYAAIPDDEVKERQAAADAAARARTEAHLDAARAARARFQADVPPLAPDTSQAPPTPPEPSHALPEPSTPANRGLRVVSPDEAREWYDERHLWHRWR